MFQDNTDARRFEWREDGELAYGAKLHPTCGYAVAWFRRHPDARDVLA
jgi:predicted GNAT family acetyltransferase